MLHRDINGNEIRVGSLALYVGTDAEPERDQYLGRRVWVRDINPRRLQSIRVDDGREKDDDVRTSKSWSWSAWVGPDELAVMQPPNRSPRGFTQRKEHP